jgi:hypothetical protein
MIAQNVSRQKIHVIVASGSHVVPSMGKFEITDDEFKMLSSFFKLEAVKEEVKEEPKKQPAPVNQSKKKAKK